MCSSDLARFSGVTDLYIKHLGWNPTGSFKDLGMTAAVTRAAYKGATFVACASTGNTAASMAAYAVRAGLKARVYLPESVASAKVAQAEAGILSKDVGRFFSRIVENVFQETAAEIRRMS